MRKLTPNLPKWLTEETEKRYANDPELQLSRADANDLLQALKGVGLLVEDLWEFVNTKEGYPEAIPVLIKYLPLLKRRNNKIATIRALTTKESKGIACQAVLAEYDKADKEDENFCFACANNLYCTATLKEVDAIVDILKDEKNGKSRTDFAEILGKWRHPEKTAMIQAKAGAIIEKLYAMYEHPLDRKRLRKVLDRLKQ